MNALHDRLTKREREVIEAWCHGLHNAEIAQALRIGIRSVNKYTERIVKGLDATCPRHAVYLWARAELAPPRIQVDQIAAMIGRAAVEMARGRLKYRSGGSL